MAPPDDIPIRPSGPNAPDPGHYPAARAERMESHVQRVQAQADTIAKRQNSSNQERAERYNFAMLVAGGLAVTTVANAGMFTYRQFKGSPPAPDLSIPAGTYLTPVEQKMHDAQIKEEIQIKKNNERNTILGLAIAYPSAALALLTLYNTYLNAKHYKRSAANKFSVSEDAEPPATHAERVSQNPVRPMERF